jgi:hypothetical protein
MPREQQETRRSNVLRRADAMALSGAFATCHAIEVSLRAEGFIEAFEVLDRSKQRQRLSELCDEAKRLRGG